MKRLETRGQKVTQMYVVQNAKPRTADMAEVSV